MIHILHYITGIPGSKGGVENFLLNLYKGTDKSKYKFSLLTRNYVPGSNVYEEFLNQGIEVISLDSERIHGISGIRSFRRKVNEFFQEHQGEYDFLHSHYIDDPFIIKAGKKNGIKKAALHAHAMEREVSSGMKKVIKKIITSENIDKADYLFACSEKAGRFYYSDRDCIVIKNAIDTAQFTFDIEKRVKIRKELGIKDETYAMCYTGRFSKIKNIPYLLEVVNELKKKTNRFILYLIGTGTTEEVEKLRERINFYGIRENVVFTGARNDIGDVLQGMDIYIQSSISEGFPFSVLEAECAGLPCVLSEGIPDSVVLTDLPKKFSLEAGAEVWAGYILKLVESSFYKNLDRRGYPEQIKGKGYDVKSESEKLCNYYG